jgi:DNA polymerase I-like protein with 3'-5' exonuclease and polymerase domains
MGQHTLAARLGCTVMEATEMLRRLRVTYPRYYAWSRDTVDAAYCTLSTRTAFGWAVAVRPDTRPNSVKNFPMQATGAEMLRLTCAKATEAALPVVAPIHDAVVIEAPEAGLDEVVAATVKVMGEASREVLQGYEVGVDTSDHTDARYPRRFYDERGEAMWLRVQSTLAALHHEQVA